MKLQRTFNMLKNIKNWDSYLLYKAGGRKKDSFTFKLRNDFSVLVPKQIIPEFKESLFEEVYYKYLPKEIYHIKNPTILDVGANVGFFTILSSLKFKKPTIISFEPIKRNFVSLQDNVSTINNDQLTIVNKAVSKTKGEITLTFENEGITTSASLFEDKTGSQSETVASTTLEDIYKDYKLSHIDLLKLDCEGAEYEIIYETPASFFDRVNCIAIETHLGKGEKENHKALASYIEGLGYNVKSKHENYIWASKDPLKWR